MHRWLLLCALLAACSPSERMECSDTMAQENILAFKGLVLQPNDLGQIPQGALAQADNVVISRDGIVEPRRGMDSLGVLGDTADRLFAFGGEIIAHDGSSLKHSADGTTWNTYPGTHSAPATPMSAAEVAAAEFITASDGVKRLDTVGGTPELAGVPEALDVDASAGATGTAVPPNSKVAYRIVFGKKTSTGRLILGAPSGRSVFQNSDAALTKDVNVVFSLPRGLDTSHFFQVYRSKASIGSTVEPDDELGLVLEAAIPQTKTATQLARAANVVTATTSAAHGYAAGQVVRVSPGGALSGHVVAVGLSSAVARSTDHGVTWSSAGITGLSGDFYALASKGDLYVAVGGSVCATSPNGLTWTACTIPVGTYRKVVWTGAQFVAVGWNVSATSPDGITWTARTLPASSTLYGIAWSGSTLVAVGDNGSGPRVETSSDGIAWTIRTLPGSTSGTLFGVAWNGSAFVAVGSGGSGGSPGVWTSPDGVTWTQRSAPGTSQYASVAWSATLSRFIAVGNSNSGTSPDGVTWTQTTGGSGQDVMHDGTNAISVTISAAKTSPDGANWTVRTIPAGTYMGVSAGGGAQFSSGEKTIASVPTTTTFTYSETGTDGTLVQGQTVDPLTGAALDTVPEGFLGAYLYTNQNTGEGILAGNDRPPLAADLATFRDTLFELNVMTPAYGEAYLLAVSGGQGLANGDAVTINGVAYNASSVLESITGRLFKIETGGTVSQNLSKTAASLIRVVNRSLATGVALKDVSDPNGVPGLIGFRATDPTSTLTVTFSRTTAWSPSAGINASPQSTPNGLVWSKPSQPDHVARSLTLVPTPVGSKGKQGYRITPTRDSLLIWKEDGLFRLLGTGGNWTIDPLDLTVQLVAPRTAVPLGGSVYALTEQGMVRANEGGVEVVSRDIEPVLLPLLAPAMRATTKAVAFAVAYESDRKIILWLPTLASDTRPTQAYVYDAFTSAWTRRTDSAVDAIVNPADDRLYKLGQAGAVPPTYCWRERKTLTADDFSDGLSSIPVAVQLAPRLGGNPGALSLWSEATWIFRQQQFSTATAWFSTNISPAAQPVELQGSWYGADVSPVNQLEIRVPVPQDKARASQMNLKWSQSIYKTPMQIQGVSVGFRACSTRVGP
jgi:hypothetical protein